MSDMWVEIDPDLDVCEPRRKPPLHDHYATRESDSWNFTRPRAGLNLYRPFFQGPESELAYLTTKGSGASRVEEQTYLKLLRALVSPNLHTPFESPQATKNAMRATHKIQTDLLNGQLSLFEDARGTIKHVDEDVIWVRFEVGDEEYLDQSYHPSQFEDPAAIKEGRPIRAFVFMLSVPDRHEDQTRREPPKLPSSSDVKRKVLDGTQRL